MTGRCVLLAALAAMFACTASAAAPRCRTLRPDRAAWAARLRPAAALRDGADVARAASVRRETQRDVVDVLVAFDGSACRWLAENGKGTPYAYAQACVRRMNESLEASRLRRYFRFRLAGAVSFDADLSSPRIDMEDVLDRFVDGWGRVTAKGALKKVVDRREACGADIVSVLTARGGYGTVGIGYSLEDEEGSPSLVADPEQIDAFGDWAYNCCSIQAVDVDYTQVHEIGHNMGAGHPDAGCAEAARFDIGPQLYPYSSGYYVWRGTTAYYTVMGYNFGAKAPSWTRGARTEYVPLPYFSSPDVYWGNDPVGTARNDNRRTLLETYAHVAGYRPARLPAGSGDVPEEENARAEAAWDFGGDPADMGAASVDCAGFTVTGAFGPSTALNGVAPYVGAVYSNGVAVGTVQLKIGKVDKRKKTCKVGGSVTLLDGKKHAVAACSVKSRACPRDVEGLTVKGCGRLSLWLGANGFAGTLAGTPYGTLEVRTCDGVGRGLGKVSRFGLGATAAGLAAAGGRPVLEACLPAQVPVATPESGKWRCEKAAKVKYVKTRGAASGGTEWALKGLDGANPSGLRLSYAPRTAVFKGSFTVYCEAGTDARPKLKKAKASVAGVVVDGCGNGRAQIKGMGVWPVWLE